MQSGSEPAVGKPAAVEVGSKTNRTHGVCCDWKVGELRPAGGDEEADSVPVLKEGEPPLEVSTGILVKTNERRVVPPEEISKATQEGTAWVL
ncbi:hypothetical protein OS493_010622 [Desmophyllum pertusum]|uniref:Uncharacterized protein n=1 Tax=Desmophyllum pertusum TaxID=174260 RepID=A0A9W9ZQU4_9CNID|nr:hypothetical protein OS493_010622 [Desmophyllum pertusum]